MMTPTSAASPTANLGAQALAAEQCKQALNILEAALPNVSLESELHSAVRTCINALSKAVPKASETGNAMQQSLMRDIALRQQSQAPLIAAMQQRGAAPGGAPAAAAPQGE